MNFQSLMIQGTSSDAGKSTIVAGLGRALHRRGIKVAPFKPQNMSLNSAVTDDGGEIGRAQALQAQACGVLPTVDMNPVLLKPNSDCEAQVIIHGRVLKNMDAVGFHNYKMIAMDAVLKSHRILCETFDNVLVEGAGSPAEINLRDRDIANMGFAEAADCPVVIVADIDRGGVFAQLVGTLELLSRSEQARVVGFIINKFRGDIALLESGLQWLEKKTHVPVLGVIPYIHELWLDAEDSITTFQSESDTSAINIVVPVLPHISNHTDFDALRLHTNVNFQFCALDTFPTQADLIIIPGSKNVIGDLTALNNNNWKAHLDRHLRYGGKLMGICGGMQMLGSCISDPHNIESNISEINGFNYLNIKTELYAEKLTRRNKGTLHLVDCTSSVEGYEIHCGRSDIHETPLIIFDDGEEDGAVSDDGQVIGTYLHGVFDSKKSCSLLLNWAGTELQSDSHNITSYRDVREEQIDRLADILEQHLCMDKICHMLR